jgi:acyl-coenzyme A synthetase/AMP-(fatty) acid ligase
MKLKISNRANTIKGSFTLNKVLQQFVLPDLVSKLQKIAFVADDPFLLLGACLHIYTNKCDGLLINSNRINEELISELQNSGYSICHISSNGDIKLSEQNENKEVINGRISVLTSGTTGKPKLISHTWQTLFTQENNRSFEELNWLVTYAPGTYAWYQLITMWMFRENISLSLPPTNEPEEMYQFATENYVTAISSTPTLWRYLFYKIPKDRLQQIALKQITLGGEAIHQSLLNDLQIIFPHSRLTQIYASTEGGAAIIVNDGKEGFPVEWLKKNNTSKPSLMVKDNKLWLRSPYQSTDFDGWYCTNDQVEIRNSRVVVAGRAGTGFLNIGGNKANARNIEEKLLMHEDIYWCRVYSKKAPIVGELVAAEVLCNGATEGKTKIEMEKMFTEHCMSIDMNDWMIPRLWKFLKEIPITHNMKTELR